MGHLDMAGNKTFSANALLQKQPCLAMDGVYENEADCCKGKFKSDIVGNQSPHTWNVPPAHATKESMASAQGYRDDGQGYESLRFPDQQMKRIPETGVKMEPGRRFFLMYLLLVLCFLLIFMFFGILLGKVLKLSSEVGFPCGSRSREWEYFDGQCYYFSVETVTWQRARSQCQAKNSDLVVIHDEAEQNFIQSRTRKEKFWIGLHDLDIEGEWKWVDGTDYRTSFKNWMSGEPNDNFSKEDCAQISVAGEWNDISCNHTDSYVCEKRLPS
ncbi:hepatic lectin-like [Hemicordylus capensis]|uniref:hepatic lectin-like n=1 Tax=Hemicordylus capensis TaxID=884348 RepID=UPI002302B9C6|nr:hepatic lectin-like [Hemicordylus capensis]